MNERHATLRGQNTKKPPLDLLSQIRRYHTFVADDFVNYVHGDRTANEINCLVCCGSEKKLSP